MKESEIISDIIKGGAESVFLIAKKSPAPPKKMMLEEVRKEIGSFIYYKLRIL